MGPRLHVVAVQAAGGGAHKGEIAAAADAHRRHLPRRLSPHSLQPKHKYKLKLEARVGSLCFSSECVASRLYTRCSCIEQRRKDLVLPDSTWGWDVEQMSSAAHDYDRAAQAAWGQTILGETANVCRQGGRQEGHPHGHCPCSHALTSTPSLLSPLLLS